MSYVYVMSSASLPEGVFKIGVTRKKPYERAKELSNQTAAFSPFYVVYYDSFMDAFQVEQQLHDHFAAARINDSKEYFKVPIHKIIMKMEQLKLEEIGGEWKGYPWTNLFATFKPRLGYEDMLAPEEIEQCQKLEEKLARNA